MGGYGSGRYGFSFCKSTTSDCIAIDVRRWQREGLLTSPRYFDWKWLRNEKVTSSIEVIVQDDHVILNYKYRRRNQEWQKKNCPVYLDWTSCNYGGKRPWFLCPVRGCGRRVAKLYSNGVFACRQCHQVAYPSQRENDMDRANRRADKIRARLDWEPGILNGNGLKPKGMHWSTFERLQNEHDYFVDQSILGAAMKFNISVDSLERGGK